MSEGVEPAAAAIRRGDMAVYPTETVYGLGADALDPAAIERVFTAKNRPRDAPISLAVPSIAAGRDYVVLTDHERRFMRTFLPGPVTVVVERRPLVPAVLTGGRDRVGVRIPDHPVAQALLDRVAPITATSANVSGGPSTRRVDDLDPRIRAAAAAIVDGGPTTGGASTVVDVAAGEIIRPGARAEDVAEWLAGT